MPTIADKTNAVLDGMVAEVRNRRNAPATVPATPTAKPAEPQLSGSVEQAREIVARTVADLRKLASDLEFGMDLVFSLHVPGPAPVNVEEARKRAEAEADARHREPASEAAVAEMVAAAPPILAKPDGWTCPDHGKVVVRTSRKTGREYRACPVEGCIEIERRA